MKSLPILLLGMLLCLPTLADMRELQLHGTKLRLQGNFEAAETIEQQLLDEFDIPVGHIFAINSIITHLTWDESDDSLYESLLHHTDKTLEWCEQIIDDEPDNPLGPYYCGQASFALSYYHGLSGNYLQAGTHGTRSINYLEDALAIDSSLTDAKMHLGVAYYVADNLPPYIKFFSRFLWFIPTGNSEKSLPYLHDVMTDGDIYRDVAKYIYAITLLDETDKQDEAEQQLRYLVENYPGNPRFQLRLISLLLVQDKYQATLDTAQAYLASAEPPVDPELGLTKIWMVRANMGLGNLEEAINLFDEIDALFQNAKNELPGWSLTWHMLTDGQLHDLSQQRERAEAIYQEIIDISESTYVNDMILEAARNGLQSPYKIP